MSPSPILVVLRKELLDISRDRRAIFVMLVLPIVLYPLIIIGFTQATVVQMRTIGQRTAAVWFRGSIPSGLRARLEDSKLRHLSLQDEPPGADEAAGLASGTVRAILVVPPSLEKELTDLGTTAHLEIVYNGGVDASSEARRHIVDALEEWRKEIVAARLRDHGLEEAALEPIAPTFRDVAPKGAILGRMLAYILVMTSLMGSFYPALDMGAGEKERGTLETLLLVPASRAALATGKFAAVFVIAFLNTVMNLASLGLTFAHFGSLLKGADVPEIANVTVSLPVVLVALLVLVPTIALFSALALAIATQAKSYKEGTSYLQPLVITSVLLSLASALPGIELSTGLCLVPVAGPAVLVRELLGGTARVGHAALVVLSSASYAALAIRYVGKLYETEDVLVRPAAAKGLDLLVRASPAFPGGKLVPTLPQGIALSVLVLVLVWFAGTELQKPPHELPGLVATLLLIVAAPPLMYARKLGLDLRATFRIVPPPALALAAAVLIAVGGNVLAMDIDRLQEHLTGERLPAERANGVLEQILAQSFPVALLVIAVLPGICEEVLFRGFVLSGLSKGAGPVSAAVVSAFLFAVTHLDPAKLGAITFLGILLAALALRSGSIFPSMLCHATNNAFALALAKAGETLEQRGFFRDGVPSMGVRAGAVVLLLLGTGLLVLVRPGSSEPGASAPAFDARGGAL